MPNDYLLAVGGRPGQWIKLHNNNTAVDYFSTARTDGNGMFIHSAPPGHYTLYASANVALPAAGDASWIGTGDTDFPVALTVRDDAVFNSVTVKAVTDSGPYVPILPAGSSALYGHKFSFAPAGGTTDDGPNLQTLINAAPANSIIEFQPGTYLINTPVTPKSNQTYTAARGSVTLKRTVVGDIFVSTTQALDSVTFSGLTFDCTGVAWSAIDFFGSDANGQITNLTIRDCFFKNPSTTWMVQINYTIVDPAIPTSKNRNIRMEDCYDDATGGTFSLENIIFVNCQDVYVSGCRFLNTPAALAAHVAFYGYCRNVRMVGNYIEQYLSFRAVYVVQSDSVSFVGDQFRTTGNVNCIQIFNSKDIKVVGSQMVTGASGTGVWIDDFSGATFDGHTNLYSQTTGVSVQDCRMDTLQQAVLVQADQVQGQTDIEVSGNMVAVGTCLFRITGIPNAPSAAINKISVVGNHVISHSGVSGGTACVAINGNATAANGGITNVLIANNLFLNPGQGGCDIEVLNKADAVTITGNHHAVGALTPVVIAAAATNVVWNNNSGANARSGQAQFAFAASFTPAFNRGDVISIAALTANITINAVTGSIANGQLMTLIFTQDGTGGRTITWNAAYKTAWQPLPAANAISSITFVFDNSGALNVWRPLAGIIPVDQLGNARILGALQRSRQTPTETVLVSGVDATAGELIGVTITAARVVGAPLNPQIGQRLTFTFIQGGAGAFAITWNAVFKKTWVDTGNATAARSSISFQYDGTNWNQDGAQAPYV